MTEMQLMINESDVGDLDKYITPFSGLSDLRALSLILEVEEILSNEKVGV